MYIEKNKLAPLIVEKLKANREQTTKQEHKTKQTINAHQPQME